MAFQTSQHEPAYSARRRSSLLMVSFFRSRRLQRKTSTKSHTVIKKIQTLRAESKTQASINGHDPHSKFATGSPNSIASLRCRENDTWKRNNFSLRAGPIGHSPAGIMSWPSPLSRRVTLTDHLEPLNRPTAWPDHGRNLSRGAD
jgi:hypothetical protein